MQRASYGNYDTNTPQKTFAGNVPHASKCLVDVLTLKVDALEKQMAQQYPLECKRCPDSKVDCSQAQDPQHCNALQQQCMKKGCY